MFLQQVVYFFKSKNRSMFTARADKTALLRTKFHKNSGDIRIGQTVVLGTASLESTST